MVTQSGNIHLVRAECLLHRSAGPGDLLDQLGAVRGQKVVDLAQLRTLGHLLVAVALPWVLLSQVVVQPCDQRGCVPPDELPLQSQRELGRYARHEICEAVREALAQAWAQLEAEADQDRTAPPQGGETRVVTTFVCERDAGTPPEAAR